MYRHLSHAPSRSLSGHVCLSCRRQFHATTRQRKDDKADDWLANFNDLSAAQETKSWHKDQSRRNKLLQEAEQQNISNRPQIETESEPKKDVNNDSKPQATSFESLRAKLNYATRNLRFGLGRRAQESTLDDTSSQALEGIPREAEAKDHASQPVRQAYESVLADLIAEQNHEQGNTVASGPLIRRGAPRPTIQASVYSGGFADSPGELADQRAQQEAATVMVRPSKEESGPFQGRIAFKELGRKIEGSDDKDSMVSPEQEEATVPLDRLSDGHQATTTEVNPPTLKTLKRRRERRRKQENKRVAREMKANETKANETKVNEPQEAQAANSGSPTSESQVPESEGYNLAEIMEGRQLSQAMKMSDEARPSTKDADDSGLPTIKAKDLRITPLNVEQPPVPGLSHGLDKVLFNPGVMALQDQHSRVYNFDPYLQHIMPVEEFDFNALQQYKTSSQDSALSELAKQYEKKYVGSTSSMTSTLSHFHYLLSGWRDLNTGMLSRQFPDKLTTFTLINRAPTAIFLRWKNGTYAIDADKEHDSGNILMMLGKSMEKLLTLSESDYERYRKSDPRQISEEERNLPEAYEYTAMGDFLMRSQLDAYDPRLPGTGMFDIKTRAVSSIRMSTSDYKPMLGYEILTHQGKWESYEREYYEMMRSTMLKYMLQARMGRMDGIFLAYHNVQRMFGFQYMPIAELDHAIHGQIDRCLGDQEFKFSIDLLNKVLDQATTRFPNKSLRLHFETRTSPVTAMYVFAEPMEEEQIDKIQATSKEKIAQFERKMMGIEATEQQPADTQTQPSEPSEPPTEPTPPSSDSSHAPLYAATLLIGSSVNGQRVERPESLCPDDDWTIEYLLKEIEDPADAWATYAQCKATRQKVFARVVETGDEDGAESLDPNLEMHESDGSVRTFDDYYLEMLRRLAEKGREYRRRIDEVEEGMEKVVFREKGPESGGAAGDESASASTSGSDEGAVDVEKARIGGVEDYMQWMYKGVEMGKPGGGEGTGSDESEIRGVDDYMSWMFKRV